MKLERLSWDSDFFGFPVARLHVEGGEDSTEIEDLLTKSQNDFRLVYAMTQDSTMAKAMAELHPDFQDEKVWFVQSLKNTLPTQEHLISFLGRPLEGSLFGLALQAGHESRFTRDPGFDPEAFRGMYRIWMEKSLSGDRSWEVLCLIREESPIGFITLDRSSDPARTDIGLLAVDDAYRGQGMGKILMQGAKHAAYAAGYKALGVPTQRSNSGACRYYQSVGFTEESNTFIFHFWHHGN
ncbi:MAG TPA: hypothetical protein DCE41_06235 [Cytophagales bacterium]|nr:hypothetical protein [Cytophagales bacterium]HAA19578.1 hypothetical protein [Cytophagales bacterium]HAP58753.1 hypothetical protein [Cytophagales bacterium]